MSFAHILILSEYLASTASGDTDKQPFIFRQKAEILRRIGDRQADIEVQRTTGDEEDSDDDSTPIGSHAAEVHVTLVHGVRQIREDEAELQHEDATSDAVAMSVGEAADGRNAGEKVVCENNTTEGVLMQSCSLRTLQARQQ